MQEKILLKDKLFNKEKVEYLANIIKNVYADFEDKKFEKEVLSLFNELELKQRIKHISNMLEKYLPKDFETSLNIILKTLPELPDLNKTDNDFGDFIFAPYWEYIASNWSKKEFLNISLNALETLTSYFSMEDAIRTFLNEFETETYEKIIKWTKSSNYHIRRLATEWTRPKLPWAKRIKLDYRKAEKILNNLYNDNTRYVTRSVANHLNDISKIDIDFVLELLKKWKNKTKNSKELDFVIKHSLRGLVKKWDKKTLEFLWFNHKSEYEINNFYLKSENIRIWENLEFEFEIANKSEIEANFVIDYKINFIWKNNKLNSKVYKIKKINLGNNEFIKINKKHPLKIMTTRKLYSWEHYISIQINWNNSIDKSFFIL